MSLNEKQGRIVSHCFAFMPVPNSWQRPADVNSTTKPEQSNTSSLQHATTFSHLKKKKHIHLVVMRPFSQPTTSHYRLMAPEIFIPCIQSEISEKDSNWRMTTDSVKVSYADSNSRGTSRPPHCVFFHLYTAERSCFFFIPVKFSPLHRWMVILHMAKQWDQQMWK